MQIPNTNTKLNSHDRTWQVTTTESPELKMTMSFSGNFSPTDFIMYCFRHDGTGCEELKEVEGFGTLIC
jgi:hypothetical protein